MTSFANNSLPLERCTSFQKNTILFWTDSVVIFVK